MKAETAKILETELRRFAADLNLSDDQKTQLKAGLENAHDHLDEIRAQNPDITRADVRAKIVAERDSLRQRVENFFTPDQLTKWDAEVTKAKDFLGMNVS